MAFSETFDTDLGGFTAVQDVAFDGANGFPSAGCASFDNVLPAGGGSLTIGSITEGLNSTPIIGFWYRAVINSLSVVTSMISIQLTFSVSGAVEFNIPAPTTTGDTGWVFWSQSLSAYTGETISDVLITTLNEFFGQGTIYIDGVEVGTTAPTPGGSSDRYRIIGIVADNAYLYQTVISNDILTLSIYDFAEYPIFESVTYGSISYTAPDSLTYGLWPVRRAEPDGEIFLIGATAANGPKMLRNENIGNLAGFSEVGLGSAEWGTAGVVVSLMSWELAPSDWLVGLKAGTFSYIPNGDSGEGWVGGDDIANIVTANRDISGEKVLAGGASGGSIYYSGNHGLSFVSGGTVGGSIRWIEFSQ